MKRSTGLLAAALLTGWGLGGTTAQAFPADVQGPTVLAAKPRKGAPVNKQKQEGDEEGEVGEPPADEKTMRCMTECQQPAMRCMGKCGNDMKCAAKCAERMHTCGQKCGLEMPED